LKIESSKFGVINLQIPLIKSVKKHCRFSGKWGWPEVYVAWKASYSLIFCYYEIYLRLSWPMAENLREDSLHQSPLQNRSLGPKSRFI